jgi:hypothetical protein
MPAAQSSTIRAISSAGTCSCHDPTLRSVLVIVACPRRL